MLLKYMHTKLFLHSSQEICNIQPFALSYKPKILHFWVKSRVSSCQEDAAVLAYGLSTLLHLVRRADHFLKACYVTSPAIWPSVVNEKGMRWGLSKSNFNVNTIRMFEIFQLLTMTSCMSYGVDDGVYFHIQVNLLIIIATTH